MIERRLTYWAIILTAIVVLLILRQKLEQRQEHRHESPAAAPGEPTALAPSPPLAPAAEPDRPAPPAPRRWVSLPSTGPAASTAATAPASIAPEFTNFPPTTVLDNLRSAFHSYCSTFNGNPVGTNPEITAALNGGNAKQAKFIREEDGLRINERGELVDPWGTPFFFHQLSAREMEIHCAGPDREMWTADDLVIR